jgi:hypothetical protein
MLHDVLLLHMSQEETILYEVRHRPTENEIKAASPGKSRNLRYRLPCVIAVILALSAILIYLRYRQPTYIVSVNLKNRDTENVNNWQHDELGKLKLRSAISAVVKDLNLSIRYQKKGWIVNQELYPNSPIKFQLVRTGASIAKQFQVSIKDGNDYQLKDGDRDAGAFAFNKIYTTEIGSWIISKMPSYPDHQGQTILIDVQNPDIITDRLLSEMLSTVSAHDRSFTQFSIEDKVQSRGEAILGKVIAQLNTSSAQESATKVAIDIKQLDQQLLMFDDKVDSLQKELNALSGAERNLQLSSTATNYLKAASANEILRNEINFRLMALNDLSEYIKYQDLNTILPPSTVVLSNPNLANLVGQLIVLQSQRHQLLESHLETDPVFKPLLQQTASIKALMVQNIISLRSELLKRQADVESFDQRAKQMLNLMPGRERNLVHLKRKQINYENRYAFLLKRKEEAMLKQAAYSPPLLLQP